MQGTTICPICHGLEKEYRVGLDTLYRTKTRNEYDEIKPSYEEQLKKETLVIEVLNFTSDNNGNMKIVLFARCNNCNSTWKFGQTIAPEIGDV